VNYATGDETLKQVYGYDEWRLEKLRALKAKWDPEGRFNHYHPIY
jgi:FAD/FMN-containing dehydrogenase